MSYRPLFSLYGHTNTVYSVAFSQSDPSRLASGSYDSTVKVWNLAAGREEITLYGHAGAVSTVTFSPVRHRLTTGSNDRRIKLWRLLHLGRLWRGWQKMLGFQFHTGAVYSVIFTRDERYLISSGTDNTVRIADLAGSQPPIALVGHTGYVYQVALSPDDRWLASASLDRTIRLWDLDSVLKQDDLNPVAILRQHTGGVTSVAFSPDGRWLASGSYDTTIRLWDLRFLPHDLTLLRHPAPVTLRAHEDCVQCVTFSPDGSRLASASSDNTVRIWDIREGHRHVLATLRRHTDHVHTVAFSPDGTRLASGGRDQIVVIWTDDH